MRSFVRAFHIIVLSLIVVSACATPPPITATPLPPTPTPVMKPVSFTTPDGATIGAVLYGSGDTVVIFSVMGNCRRGWEELAERAAQNGLTALTYQWRDCGPSGPVNERQMSQNFLNDARGAISFLRDQGVEKIILAGASLGGLASAKLAMESDARGLVVFASPAEIPQWDFEIGAADLDTDIPKLFLTADNDSVVPLADSQALYDLAAEPREWQTYPGTAHGTDLFDKEHGEEAQQRILDFILAVASQNP